MESVTCYILRNTLHPILAPIDRDKRPEVIYKSKPVRVVTADKPQHVHAVELSGFTHDGDRAALFETYHLFVVHLNTPRLTLDRNCLPSRWGQALFTGRGCSSDAHLSDTPYLASCARHDALGWCVPRVGEFIIHRSRRKCKSPSENNSERCRGLGPSDQQM